MSKLSTISTAVAFAALLSASPSFAGVSESGADSYEFTKVEVAPMKAHGKTFMVHVMTMADGSLMYAMSKRDIERLFDEKIKEQQGH